MGQQAAVHYPPLLARDGRRRGMPAARARERPVGPFAGQELVRRGAAGWTCAWECPGRPGDPLAPMLQLELKSGLGEAATLGLWDALLESLRRRESFAKSLRLPEAFQSS